MRGRMIALALALLTLAFPARALTLTWNEVNDETYGATVGARVFADTLYALSGGEMEIDLYTDGALGFEMESMQGLQMGVLDIFRGNASTLGDYGAELIGATGLPYLFKSMEDFETMAESPLGQELLDSVEAADCGFIALSWLVEGPRNMFITERTYEELGRPEAITLDMMRDLNIRVPGTRMLIDTVGALGSAPIEVAYSEMLPALKSGNIDGAENGVIPYLSQGFYQAAPYYIDDAHIFGCGVVLVSSAAWESLTDQQKDWMREAGEAARDACYAHNLREQDAYYEQFPQKGVTVLPVADIEAWQDACDPIYESQSPAVQDVIHRIRAREY